MPREILTFRDKAKADRGTRIYEANEIISKQGLALIYLSDMRSDGSTSVNITFPKSIQIVDYFNQQNSIKSGNDTNLSDVDLIVISSNEKSAKVGDRKLTLKFKDAIGDTTWTAELALSVVDLSLIGDFDRDGKLDDVSDLSQKWSWGASGTGLILLVNSDRDTAHPNPHFRDRLDRRVNGPLDLEDMTSMKLNFDGPRGLDLIGYSVRLHVSDAAASRLRIFDASTEIPEVLVEPGMPIAVLPAQYRSWNLALEGIDYPDSAFSGLITVFVELERMGAQYADDKVVIRVAPWLALPNTQPAKRLYIAEMEDGSNKNTIRDIKKVAKAADVELLIVPSSINRGDRWLQDEIEIGFASRPGKKLSVVLDSPRNRQLDNFPEVKLLGTDFGYVTRGNDEERSSLDSFGNLDCTPPHTGPYGEYPFGRLIFGGSQPGAKKGRRMMKVVSDFLYAQQVQYPIELYSDWLGVGHVDEFMSFVPATDRKKFRLVLASPYEAYAILEKLNSDGKSDAVLFEGKRFEQKVSTLLSDVQLRQQNDRFQEYIDWNKSVLIRELGLNSEDIIYLPAIYYIDAPDGRAGAFFPGMVNMQVINSHLAIPKPFGYVLNGECVFESNVRQKLEPLGLTCHFVDTYEGYHLQLGEIHCGTNVVREPFARNWWEFDPAINAPSES